MFYLSCETNLWLEFWVIGVYGVRVSQHTDPVTEGKKKKEAIITSSLPTVDDQVPHLSTYDLGAQTFSRFIEFLTKNADASGRPGGSIG